MTRTRSPVVYIRARARANLDVDQFATQTSLRIDARSMWDDTAAMGHAMSMERATVVGRRWDGGTAMGMGRRDGDGTTRRRWEWDGATAMGMGWRDGFSDGTV
ncbi:hypothetical protein B0H12DRAFT_1077287 [Mycena haematopus]|nr:hypothetical protein B0H12DRAFT_1077287 [Mycena haematopus]